MFLIVSDCGFARQYHNDSQFQMKSVTVYEFVGINLHVALILITPINYCFCMFFVWNDWIFINLDKCSVWINIPWYTRASWRRLLWREWSKCALPIEFARVRLPLMSFLMHLTLEKKCSIASSIWYRGSNTTSFGHAPQRKSKCAHIDLKLKVRFCMLWIYMRLL